MKQRATFYTALVVAVLGLCLGAADIAFAGTNADARRISSSRVIP